VGEPSPRADAGFSLIEVLIAMIILSVGLLAESKGPDEMRFAELGRYIDALKRSGNDANKLIVEQALKLALPATCLIIALFGAPLAVTTPRAGPAGGVAISLAIALIFLLLTQLTKAIGAGGVINPLVAAWFPNVMFLFAALVLLAKVRTWPGSSLKTPLKRVSSPDVPRVASSSGSAASLARAGTSPLSRIALISDAKTRRSPIRLQ